MATCAVHADAEATGTCARCGRFFCGDDSRLVVTAYFCTECSQRAEVDWLGHYRRLRDGHFSDLVILLMALCAFTLAAFPLIATWLLQAAETQTRIILAAVMTSCTAWIVGALCVLARSPHAIAKYGVGATVATAVAGAVTVYADGPVIVPLVIGGVGLLSTVMLKIDVRTMMYLRVPVSDAALLRYYEQHGSNEMAATAAALSIVGFIIPIVPVVSFLLGLGGLLRYRPRATPPVRGLPDALFAITLSVAALAMWTMVFRR